MFAYSPFVLAFTVITPKVITVPFFPPTWPTYKDPVREPAPPLDVLQVTVQLLPIAAGDVATLT
jgi:hypothetical protein